MINWKLASSTWEKEEYLALLEQISLDQFSLSEKVKKMEENFAKWNNAKYCVMVNSGSSANLLMIASLFFTNDNKLRLKKGDEVIVPAQTHVATAHAVEYTGAKAVFADINLYDGNINIESIKSKINKRTKGIIIVHFAGYPCEIDKILKICRDNKLKLIEDCAHALGTYYKNKHVGNFGHAGVFSFYPTKQITTGEGGMVITSSKKIYNSVKQNKAFGEGYKPASKGHMTVRSKSNRHEQWSN